MSPKRTRSCFVFVSAVLALSLCRPAVACSWAVFTSPNTAVVGRTMDWTNRPDDAKVMGIGRGVTRKTAESGTPLEYVTRHASIQIESLGVGISDALNEKGLQGSVLYLEGSRMPILDAKDARHDMDPYLFLGYAVSTCATVKEVVLSLGGFNFLPREDPLVAGSEPSHELPLRYVFADAAGDNAVIEFIDGKVEYYLNSGALALANEPPYSVIRILEEMNYQPNGSISTIDRQARARLYLADMRERGVDETPRAIKAMRGLLATVFAGYSEIDPDWGETYHTQWWTVIDLKNPAYYLTRLESWCAEIYDFGLFPREGFMGVIKPSADCPYEKITTGKPE